MSVQNDLLILLEPKKTILRHFPCFQSLKHHGSNPPKSPPCQKWFVPKYGSNPCKWQGSWREHLILGCPPQKKQPPCHFFCGAPGEKTTTTRIYLDVSLSGFVAGEKKTCHFQKHSETFVAPGGVVLKLAHIHVHCIENLKKKNNIPSVLVPQVSKRPTKT